MSLLGAVQVALLGSLAWSTTPALGRTWIVENNSENPIDQIGAIVMAAESGDSILIGPGLYYEHIPIGEKSLTFISRDGPEATILDGARLIEGREGAILYQAGDRTGDLIIEGLAFRNGTGVDKYAGYTSGGAVYWNSGRGMVDIGDCVFEDNEAGSVGGAVFLVAPNLRVHDCRFVRNAAYNGGAALISTGEGIIEGCVFELSVATDLAGDPAGIYLASSGDIMIRRCEFLAMEHGSEQHSISGGGRRVEIEDNRFIDLGGTLATAIRITPEGNLPDEEISVVLRSNLFVRSGSTPPCDYECITIEPNGGDIMFEGNTFFRAPDIYLSGSSPFHVTANIFFETQFSYVGRGVVECNDSWPEPPKQPPWPVEFRDNISADPLFCNPLALDFHISETSRCAEENAPEGCGQIGRFPAACYLNPVIDRSWGQIKHHFSP